MAVSDVLKELVAINTIADNNNGVFMDHCEKVMTEMGFSTSRLTNAETGKQVLICQYGEDPALAFLGHSDTVDITDGWVTDPFTLTDKGDGMLYGLGACDMKGGLACAVQAIKETDLKSLKRGIKMYFTYDEEIFFNGIWDLVKAKEDFPEHAIVCEPSCMGPGTWSKGLLEIIFTFNGVTTHSSTPIPGKSSNKNAVRFLNKMMDFEESLRGETIDCYDIPYCTMNIGIIDGGTSINKVPAKTTVYLDYRIVNSKEQYDRIINAIKENLAWACGGDESLYSYEIINDIPSFYNGESKLAQMMREETGVETSLLNGITEASFFEGDRVIFGPGPMTAHEKNEHVSKADLEKCVEIYKKVIDECCR